jgi:uncharacterized membrane protein YozB (DUF420 family)
MSDKVVYYFFRFLGSLACRTADVSGVLTVPVMSSSIKHLPGRQRPGWTKKHESKYQQHSVFGRYAFQIWALVSATYDYTEIFFSLVHLFQNYSGIRDAG